MRNFIAYAQLVRLPNTFTAMADIFLGALATGLLLSHWPSFVCLLAASTCLYWSGMIWNDVFDIDQDRKERPGRPLASGRVSLGTAKTLAIALMAGGLVFAFLAGLRFEEGSLVIRWRPVVIASLLIIMIFLYDGVFKASWAGPILMGLCRFLNILLGLSILGATPPFWGWLLALTIGTYIAGVTWFARTEARDSSQPMLIGAAIVMFISLLLALAVPAVLLVGTVETRLPYFPQPSFLFLYLLAAFGGFLGLAVLRAILRPEPTRVQPAVRRAILGLVLLDALLASAFIGTAGLLLAILLVPGMILGRWLYST